MPGSIHIHVASRDLKLASVRYRGLLPGCALEALGWDVEVGSGDLAPSCGTSLVLAVKPLSAKDAAWVRKVAREGAPVVVDLCDNVFVDGYGGQGKVIGERLTALCSDIAAMMVPTTALRDTVVAQTGLPSDRVLVVSDIVETPALLERQRKLLRQRVSPLERVRQLWRRPPKPSFGRGPVLLWFGNHGASYADFGMQDLLLFKDALREAADRKGAELWVVSNHREKFERVASQLPITSRYFEWTPEIVDVLLGVASVCLVPNSLDPFSLTKSANRAIKALSQGVPVVATPTSAYADLVDAVWLGDASQGLMAYLDGTDTRRLHLRAAPRILEKSYAFDSLQRAMAEVVAVAMKEHR